jgi:hypothetical protein
LIFTGFKKIRKDAMGEQSKKEEEEEIKTFKF